MSWGTGPWGSGGWGGGGVATPAAEGELFVESVTFITPYLLRLKLSSHVVIDELYTDPSNYDIRLHKGTGTALEVVRVLDIHGEVNSTNYLYLETDQHTIGLDYEIRIDKLHKTNGVPVSMANWAPYAARNTKTMAGLKSLPSHFDRRPDSLILNLMAAITLEDDAIGGSRNDEFST